MDQATHNRIVSFIWGIADDVLRDLFRRGKYPDVILADPAKPLRTLEKISADILAIEHEAEGLLEGLRVGEARR